MTSRFFATGDTSSSESEAEYSERAEESYASGDESSESESNDEDKGTGFEVGERLARYLRDSDSEEGEEKRVVRSARTKQQEALLSIIQQLKNHIKISDWISIQSDFDALNRQLTKYYKINVINETKKEPPKAYISAIVMLEDFLNKTVENKEKKLSKTNTKAFNAVKQRLKKNNREWEEHIRQFRESGAIPGEDLYDEDESDSLGVDEKQESEADESWDDSEEESLKEDKDIPPNSGGSQWLLKTSRKSSQAVSQKERKKSKSQNVSQSMQSLKDTVDNIPAVAFKDFNIPEDLPESIVDQKLVEIIATRGRKGTSKRESLVQLELLLKAAKNLVQEMEILFQIVSTHFDMIPLTVGYMSQDNWHHCVQCIEKIINLAFEHATKVRFVVNHPSSDTLDVSVPLRGGDKVSQVEVSLESPSTTLDRDDDKRQVVRGDLATVLERIDDDLFRAWQGIDAYLPEYVERLKDEFVLLKLLAKAQTYFEKEEELDKAARVACRRIQHLYYKPDDLLTSMIQASLQKTRKLYEQVENNKEQDWVAQDPILSGLVYCNEMEDESFRLHIPELPIHQRPLKGEQSLLRLAVLVYRYGFENLKSIVILCQIYHHALENRYYEARDMLLMSHLQESIGLLELPLQILFNRTMAQLGLCAFRQGLAQETLYCLQELCTPVHTGLGSSTVARLKELLAQGIVQQRGHEKSIEQERLERNYQVPYHMYLPVDFIEMAHLIAAMVIEIPSLTRAEAQNEAPQKRKIYSRVFQHFLRNSIRQAYPSPPENTRDYIMSASRALIRGHWKEAYQYVANIRAWESVDTTLAQSILQTWRNLIQIEGLRTFIHSYASFFDSLSVVFLSEWFELSPAKVHSLVSKMIMNEELQASWDQPSGCVVIKRWEPNRLQSLCLQLTEKCSQLIDYNERLLDTRSGGQILKNEEREEFLKTASHWMNSGGNRKSSAENWAKNRTVAS